MSNYRGSYNAGNMAQQSLPGDRESPDYEDLCVIGGSIVEECQLLICKSSPDSSYAVSFFYET